MSSRTIAFTAALAPKAPGELAIRTSLIQGAAPKRHGRDFDSIYAISISIYVHHLHLNKLQLYGATTCMRCVMTQHLALISAMSLTRLLT